MLQMMACGLKHPITAATFGALYVLGRVIYGYGYSKGGPEGRMAGERKGNASMREDRGGDAFFSLSLSLFLSFRRSYHAFGRLAAYVYVLRVRVGDAFKKGSCQSHLIWFRVKCLGFSV